MAVNRSRSQNAELDEGATDGTFKKIPRDRSAVSDPNLTARHIDFPWRYGFEDTPSLKRPDTGGPARRNPTDHG